MLLSTPLARERALIRIEVFVVVVVVIAICKNYLEIVIDFARDTQDWENWESDKCVIFASRQHVPLTELCTQIPSISPYLAQTFMTSLSNRICPYALMLS